MYLFFKVAQLRDEKLKRMENPLMFTKSDHLVPPGPSGNKRLQNAGKRNTAWNSSWKLDWQPACTRSDRLTRLS